MPIVASGSAPSYAIPSVVNIADLRLLTAGAFPVVLVRGTSTAGDGGGRLFYWAQSSAAADNSDTVIAPSSGATGRWLYLPSVGSSAYSTFIQSGTGAVAQTVSGVLDNFVWAPGFGLLTTATAAENITALGKIATRINALGAAILVIPPGTYAVNPAAGTTACSFSGLTGLHILNGGAHFNDTTSYTGTQEATLFKFTNCKNISAAAPLRVTSLNTVTTTTILDSGLTAVELLQGSQNITLDMELAGTLVGMKCLKLHTDAESYISKNIKTRIKASNCQYPLSCQFSGDQLEAWLDNDTCGRDFFVYGVENQKIHLRAKNAQKSSIISSFNGYGCRDVEVWLHDRDTTDAESAAWRLEVKYGDSTAATHSGIKIHLDTKCNSGFANWSHTLVFNKFSDGAATPDTTGRGHVLDGIEIDGISEQQAGNNSIAQGVGRFASPDVIRNFSVNGLTMTGASSAIVLQDFAARIDGRAFFRNVVAEGDIVFENGTTAEAVFIGCKAPNFTDQTTDTDKHLYIGCDITSGAKQNEADNKTFIDTKLGSTTYALGRSGSWTPVLAGSATAGTQTYAVQVGRWVRNGDVVTVSCYIALSAFDGTTAGSIRITGLPFTAKNVTNFYQSVAIGYHARIHIDVAGGKISLVGWIPPNTTMVELLETGDNVAGANITAADIGNLSEIMFTASYIV